MHTLSSGTSWSSGGELLFLDDDIDSQLAPKAGQLVFFSSGLELLVNDGLQDVRQSSKMESIDVNRAAVERFLESADVTVPWTLHCFQPSLLIGTQECSPCQTHGIWETLGACDVVHLQPQAHGSSVEFADSIVE